MALNQANGKVIAAVNTANGTHITSVRTAASSTNLLYPVCIANSLSPPSGDACFAVDMPLAFTGADHLSGYFQMANSQQSNVGLKGPWTFQARVFTNSGTQVNWGFDVGADGSISMNSAYTTTSLLEPKSVNVTKPNGGTRVVCTANNPGMSGFAADVSRSELWIISRS
jgi:hypothetical protein